MHHHPPSFDDGKRAAARAKFRKRDRTPKSRRDSGEETLGGSTRTTPQVELKELLFAGLSVEGSLYTCRAWMARRDEQAFDADERVIEVGSTAAELDALLGRFAARVRASLSLALQLLVFGAIAVMAGLTFLRGEFL